MPDFISIAGVITALAAVLVPTGAFLAVHVQEKNKRKLASDKNETEEEKAELNAQDSALKILNDRLDKADVSARESREEFRKEVIGLKSQIETLNDKLTKFDEIWQAVISAVQQLFWQIYRQWPEGVAPPTLNPGLIHKLDQAKVGHIFPTEWRKTKDPE